MKYVIDTHALIWFLEGNSRLGENAKNVLSDPNSELILPAIALAEAVWIVERGRTSIPSVVELFNAVKSDPRLVIYSLNEKVIQETFSLLTITEMHDRQIVATVLVLASQGENVSLLTCDQNITESALVLVVW
ncbi:MAG: type II toxin-antitoxin system VapC family toxin [Crocosphaera sp.]